MIFIFKSDLYLWPSGKHTSDIGTQSGWCNSHQGKHYFLSVFPLVLTFLDCITPRATTLSSHLSGKSCCHCFTCSDISPATWRLLSNLSLEVTHAKKIDEWFHLKYSGVQSFHIQNWLQISRCLDLNGNFSALMN